MLLMCHSFTLGQLKIVPLGNSITQGAATSQGKYSYRRNLWHKLNDAGYSVDFVGSLDTDNKDRPFPDATFDHDHEGHWGWRADSILGELAGWLAGYTPDVALIHLGSNDANQGNTVASTLAELEAIIGVLRSDNAQITIFLAQILPLEDAEKNANINGINAGLVPLAANLDQAQSRIILVDQNSGWNIATHTYDGVHPNSTGEERMAQRWFNAFDAFYGSENQAPEITAQRTLSVNEDQQLSLRVSDFTINDPDSNPGDMSLSVYGGDHYSVNGTSILPEANWHGTLSVRVTVNDGASDSPPYDAVVTVNPVNDAPIITAQSELVVLEEQTLELGPSDFTVFDVDHPSGPFTLAVQPGSNYSYEANRVTPSKDYAGVLRVPVVVSDGSAASNPFNAVVMVANVNDPPAITGQEVLVVDEDQQLTLHVSDFSISDPDTDLGEMSLTISQGSHYTVNGTSVVPDLNWFGTLSVGITVNDGEFESEAFEASVSVNPVNDAPVVADIPDQSIQTGEGFEVIDLGMYVDDPETLDEHMSWTVEGAEHLSVTIVDQEATISPLDENWTGSETLVFIATDDDPEGALSGMDEASFTVDAAVSIAKNERGSLGLYPNPSNGEFMIGTYGDPVDLVLIIYDAQGRMLRMQHYEHVSSVRDHLHAYPDGIYHMMVITGDKTHHMTFIKQ
jgi:hypothetical protein